MKTLILAIMMVAGMTVSAQQRVEKGEQLKPEQRAELRAKEMTLALDLNERQQKDIKALYLDRAKKAEAARAQFKAAKEAGKKPTADEKFAMKSRMLDEQIAMKAEMKKILTADQYAKWEQKKEHMRKSADKRRAHVQNKRR
jgi:periplasmic protein CpxP/Spy